MLEKKIGDLCVGDVIIWDGTKRVLVHVDRSNGHPIHFFQMLDPTNPERVLPGFRTDLGAYLNLRVELYGRCIVCSTVRFVNRTP